MTPFLLTFIIPHLNSGRNLDAAEIHGETKMLFTHKGVVRVRISEIKIFGN